MRNVFLSFLLFASGCASALAADQTFTTQIQMLPPPAEPKHVVTKEYADGADAAINTRLDNAVMYDEDGNISYPAGMSLRVEMPDGTKHDVLATDTNGNTAFGSGDKELNVYASNRPTAKIGDGVSSGFIFQSDMTEYVTEAELSADMAAKADLVSGVVPDAQIPAHVKVNNWAVATAADLVTLVNATVNDRAFVGDSDPSTDPEDGDGTYYLISMPPTDAANWRQASGGGETGTGGVESVNGLVGPAVTVDLPNFPLVQNEFADYARAADLAEYAKLNAPALVDATVNTPPASATGIRVVNAEWTRQLLTSNLGSTSPAMDGTAAAGAATTVSRADHVHPRDTGVVPVGRAMATTAPLTGGGNLTANRTLAISAATAATATAAGAAGSVVYAPDNAAATARNMAVTPAGLAAKLSVVGKGINYSTSEQDTGLKWVDGKTIYQRTYSGTTKPANNAILMSGISSIIDQWGYIDGTLKTSGFVQFNFPVNLYSIAYASFYLTDNNELALAFPYSYPIKSYGITVQYTKR